MAKVAASVTIHGIKDMTKRGRTRISKWLTRLARDISDEPESFSKSFRARYIYT